MAVSSQQRHLSHFKDSNIMTLSEVLLLSFHRPDVLEKIQRHCASFRSFLQSLLCSLVSVLALLQTWPVSSEMFRECVCAQSCPTLCHGSSVHGIFEARVLDSVAIAFSRGSPQPRGWAPLSRISCTGRQVLCHWATWKAPQTTVK